jgi:predicted DNA-binding transcriptional regulator AlpA
VTDTIPLRSPAPDPPDPPARKRRRLSPLVVDARRLARLLCAGVRTVRTWDAAGKLPAPIRIGGRVVWRVDEIRAWLAAGAPERKTWEARKAASRK